MNLREQILKEHSVKNAELIAAYIEENPDELQKLLDCILLGDKKVAQYGSWVLSKFSEYFYIEFIPYLEFILSEVKTTKHVAVSRNFAKVFMIITGKKFINYLSESDIDAIVDKSFSWIIEKEEKAAVIAFSIITLSNLMEKRSWIAIDLKQYIIDNISGSLPSFQSVGKRVLKKISKLE